MADIPMPLITDKLKARFWAKVDKREADNCWNWTASKDANGYGRIGVYQSGRTVPVLATHVALIIDGRPRPIGGHALHSCDNPTCVNPTHLRWGDNMQNTRDKITRGRTVPTEKHRATMRLHAPRGTAHCRAKLTEEQVRAIIADPRIARLIAADYGISRPYVGELKAGKKRRHG